MGRHDFWSRCFSTSAVLVPLFLLGCPPKITNDLVGCDCVCALKELDKPGGSFVNIPGAIERHLIGRVCTDATNASAVAADCGAQCPRKAQNNCCDFPQSSIKQVCTSSTVSVTAVSPGTSPLAGEAWIGACASDLRRFAGGDTGQATATALPSSTVTVLAPSVNVSGVPTVSVSTTLVGTNLFFGDILASLPDTKVLGAFTVAGPRVFLERPFSAIVTVDHMYSAPIGTAFFLLTADVGGVRNSFEATNTTPIVGTYDESAGIFTMRGTIRDNARVASGQMDLVFAFTNRPPHAVITTDALVPCTAPQSGTATLSAVGSTDPDHDVLSYIWIIDGGTAIRQTLSGIAVTVTLALGSHTVQLIVTDSHGSLAGATATVTVQNTVPPALSFSVTPACLWPPNHKMVLFGLGSGIQVNVHSACDPSPTVVLCNDCVKDNQPFLGGGQGNTTPDFLCGTGAVCLRSERQGTVKTPRIYTLCVAATDHQGNTSTATATVNVEHSQAGDKCPSVDPSLFVEDSDPRCVSVAGGPPEAASSESTQRPTKFTEKQGPTVDPRAGCSAAPGLSPLLMAMLLNLLRLRRKRS